jgi:hypothetical protein
VTQAQFKLNVAVRILNTKTSRAFLVCLGLVTAVACSDFRRPYSGQDAPTSDAVTPPPDENGDAVNDNGQGGLPLEEPVPEEDAAVPDLPPEPIVEDACKPETDSEICVRLSLNCGSMAAVDNCGVRRFVNDCGSCGTTDGCGAGGARNVCAYAVTSLTLINASANMTTGGEPVLGFEALFDGATIDRSVTGAILNIRANTDAADVGGLIMSLDGVDRDENFPPYSLCGNISPTLWNDCKFSAGRHVVKVTPLSARAGGTMTVSFTVK